MNCNARLVSKFTQPRASSTCSAPRLPGEAVVPVNMRVHHVAAHVHTPTLLLWGTADPHVTRAETDAIFAHLAGPKARHDFPGVGHEPYWQRYSTDWEQQVRGFLRR